MWYYATYVLRGELPEATDSFYVVDREDHFIGAVSLSAIVTAKAETISVDTD